MEEDITTIIIMYQKMITQLMIHFEKKPNLSTMEKIMINQILIYQKLIYHRINNLKLLETKNTII